MLFHNCILELQNKNLTVTNRKPNTKKQNKKP